MKIQCHCGSLIIDQTDELPHKAHLIPDQAWFATYDRLDTEVIDALAERRITPEEAYHQSRQLLGRATRFMWQCRACGRLYVDDLQGQLRCFAPEGKHADWEVLRGKG